MADAPFPHRSSQAFIRNPYSGLSIHIATSLRLIWLAILVVALAGAFAVQAADANLTDGCVSDYSADVDYFPDKLKALHAVNFSVEYANHYKVLRVANAYDGAPDYEYVLVQCGAPMPPAEDFDPDAQFIQTPAGPVIALSTTQLPALAQLDLLENLVAVHSGLYISADEVRQGIADGAIAELGFGANINIELALELEPDLAVAYGINPDTDAHPLLREAGVFTALDASWRENSPLGRAEWLKFIALFYNQEARANQVFDGIAEEYAALQTMAADIAEADKPAVLLNSYLSYADAWFIPGGDTYVGQLIRDAGGDPLLSTPDSSASQSLSFETVYEAGLDAKIWLLETYAVNSLADLAALDARFSDFAAFQAGAVWNNNLDENPNGGNNYYEWGAANPQLALADLLAIFHPALMPGHEFAFYRQLPQA